MNNLTNCTDNNATLVSGHTSLDYNIHVLSSDQHINRVMRLVLWRLVGGCKRCDIMGV